MPFSACRGGPLASSFFSRESIATSPRRASTVKVEIGGRRRDDTTLTARSEPYNRGAIHASRSALKIRALCAKDEWRDRRNRMWPRSLRSGDIMKGPERERKVFGFRARQPQRSGEDKVFAPEEVLKPGLLLNDPGWAGSCWARWFKSAP